MTSNSVFVGLVSHSESPFRKNQGPDGLLTELVTALTTAGVVCSSQINTRNLFDEQAYPLTSSMARASVKAEIQLEEDWFRFLRREDRFGHLVRIMGRYVRYAAGRRRHSRIVELRRLLNIEYSHVDLYQAAVESGSKWAIILEDDASSKDIQALANGLRVLFESGQSLKMANLSQSFPLDELGVRSMLKVEEAVK